jgi:hypothetical protein
VSAVEATCVHGGLQGRSGSSQEGGELLRLWLLTYTVLPLVAQNLNDRKGLDSYHCER